MPILSVLERFYQPLITATLERELICNDNRVRILDMGETAHLSHCGGLNN